MNEKMKICVIEGKLFFFIFVIIFLIIFGKYCEIDLDVKMVI